MTLIRATPVVPSAPVSILCGVFKINLKVFIVGTFVGTWIRNLIYLYIGFVGIDFYRNWTDGLVTAESYVQFGIVAVVFGFIIWWKLKK